MQAAANTNRFLTGRSSSGGFSDSEIVVSHNRLLQHIVARRLSQTVHSQKQFVSITNDLIGFAEQALAMRDLDALEEVSQVLMNLPVDAARQIGAYYCAFTIHRKGHSTEAKSLLETLVDSAPITYRARATQTLGGIEHYLGRLDEAFRFQLEALRLASNKNAHGLLTTLLARLEIATIKSLNEDQKGALAALENLAPLVQIVSRRNPLYFYFYHNELAVEFGELGRIAEAEASSKIALASPFAAAYPEWSETRQELEAKRTSATPSIVAFSRITEPEPSPQIEPQRQRVVAISPVPECKAKAEPSPQIEPQRQSQPSRALKPPRAMKAAKTARTARDKASFQRSVISFPAKATSAFKAVSILDRVLNCIGPRAPPRPH